MVAVIPFKGLRPKKELAEKVAAPPYDVVSTAEARVLAQDNPCSFLHINKPEIDMPKDTSPFDPAVYKKGAENLSLFIQDQILFSDSNPCFYIYQQKMGSHVQTGLVTLTSVDEYDSGLIKKHEFTRPDKEDDRVNHIDCLNAQVGPVFLCYKNNTQATDVIYQCVENKKAEYEFVSGDVQHVFWVIDNPELHQQIMQSFKNIPALYIADGHHRSAAASRVRKLRQSRNDQHNGNEPYNYFLSVIFPEQEMKILDYNRVVKDLNGLTQSQLLEELKEKFTVVEIAAGIKPEKPHDFCAYLQGQWFRLECKNEILQGRDVVSQLDVSILQDEILEPLLNIQNPRTDHRVGFVGGIRGLEELVKLVDNGEFAIAFACFPTEMKDLLAIADAGAVMPPKSTWFEPKLKSGLVIHQFTDS